jgi:predicted Ser/Thr protein kinase
MNAEPAPAALDALADDYEIIRELGRGGTAVVYLARQRATGDEVAIKLVRAQFAEDEEATARLAREARYVTQLHHPNVVPVREVLDLGDAGVALVMTHVPGRTLRQILRDEGALPPDRVMHLLRDVAGALDAAHALGIVHRDVKPENVFVGDDDRAVLADFGIARSMSPEAQQLTMHGVAIGTPAYMAPEQIDGHELDARADIYSLGLLGWEMLTGRRPFAGEALYSVLYHQKHVQLDDPRSQRADLPVALVSALAGAVEKERDARWTNADEFLSALEDDTHEPRDWPVSSPAAGATVRVERAGLPVPAESVVAIDWRAAMEPAPVAGTWLTSSRRLVVGSSIGALAALVFVVSAVRIHSREVAADAQRVVSEGQVVLSGSDAPKTVALAPTARTDTQPAPASDFPLSAAPAAASPSAASVPAPIATSLIATSPTATSAVASPPAAARTNVRVVVGGRHSCLLAEDGRAWCWGGNDRGQLGTASNARLTAPLTAVSGERFTALASGMSHSCGITPGGDTWCWGDNDSGQLGDGTTSSRESPVRVASRRHFRSIAAGSAFACALATDGTAWCWGSDSDGQLGDRGNGDQPAPVPVEGSRRFAALAAGWNFACALDPGGRAWCWGSNASGELGDSTRVDRRAPVPVRGGRTFTAMAAGSAHACGIASDGSAWCWGSDSNGQLGDGNKGGSSSTPVRVKVPQRFTSVAAGAVHSCGLATNGDAWCWGSNVYGQLGDDGNVDSALPVRVAGGHAFVARSAFG